MNKINNNNLVILDPSNSIIVNNFLVNRIFYILATPGMVLNYHHITHNEKPNQDKHDYLNEDIDEPVLIEATNIIKKTHLLDVPALESFDNLGNDNISICDYAIIIYIPIAHVFNQLAPFVGLVISFGCVNVANLIPIISIMISPISIDVPQNNFEGLLREVNCFL